VRTLCCPRNGNEYLIFDEMILSPETGLLKHDISGGVTLKRMTD
jgi:hypothetical protein